MRYTQALAYAVVPMLSAVGSAGCQLDSARESGPGFTVEVSALSLVGVTNARYRLEVVNATGASLVSVDLTSDRYGDGAGALTYVAPCDASANDHTVILTLLELFEGETGTTAIDPGTYVNPGPLSQTVTCRENADTPVRFDLTLARDARQGFFDVAVSFEDVFCSAKLDCQAGDLLFNGEGRDTTLVLGFACAAGADSSGTWQYLDDVVISCGAGSVVIDTSAGPGVLPAGALGVSGASPLFAAAVFRGAQALPGADMQYWNVALGFGGGTNCRLTTRGTASDGPLPNSQTPPGATYPFIVWDVTLTDAVGALTCGEAMLGGPGCPASGTCVTYATPTAPRSFAHAFNAGAPAAAGCQPACVHGACVATDACECNPGWTGAACSQDEDACAPNPCFPGVTCTDAIAPATGFTCGACPPDYTGDGQSCTQVDDCSPNPCLNGGTCTDGINSFTCACPPTHTGPTCATAVDPHIAGVTLLLHGEGADGATTFTDSSGSNHAFARNGDARISTAQARFGSSAIFVDGSGDLIRAGPSAGFAFGSGNFTVETWYRRVSRPHPYPRIWQFGPSGTSGWNTTQHWALADGHADFAPTKFVVHVWAYQGNTAPLIVSQTTIAADTWYHLAVTREGNTWRLFVNGALEGSTVWTGVPDNGISNHFIAGGANYIGNDFAHGYLDEVRITKGIARYTAAFTPPTAPFPDP